MDGVFGSSGEFDSTELDSSTAKAWTRFQARLADHLHEMEEDDLLLLEVESSLEDDDGAAPYVQFCAWGADQLRCEAVSNGYLGEVHRLGSSDTDALQRLGFAPPTHEPHGEADEGSANFWVDADVDEADRLAVMAVRALRDVYGVMHPAFLDGLPDDEVAVIEQGDSPLGEPDLSGDSEEAPAVYPVDGPEHLEFLVDLVLKPVLGHEPVHDDDGDIPIDCGDVVVFVRVLKDKPIIRLFACVASGIGDRERARFEVEVLNRDRLFFKFALHDDAILMQTDIVAWPFAPAHVRDLLDHMCRSVDQIHGDLAARLDRDSDDEAACESLHPAMQTLLELDLDEPGSVDGALAAAICDHDRELILQLLTLQQEETASRQRSRMTKLLRAALRITVERQARRAERSHHGGRGRRTQRGGPTRRRVPDPTLEEVDPEMWS